MKITITKLVGDLGEQWSIEVPITNDILRAPDPVAQIEAITGYALRAVDNRLLALNTRLLDGNRMAQTLTPEALLALRQTVEVMYGTRIAPDGPNRPQVSKDEAPPRDPSPAAEKVALALEKALEATDEGRR